MAEVPDGAELIVDARLSFPTIKCENIYILPGHPGDPASRSSRR